MTVETVVAIFDDVLAIEAACAELTALGIDDAAISWTGAPVGTAATQARPARERSFWCTLFGGEPDHDTGVYDHCIATGANMLTVRTTTAQVDDVMAILERHGPIDIKERAAGFEPVVEDTVYGSGEAMGGAPDTFVSGGTLLVECGTTRVRRFVAKMAATAREI